MIKLALPVITNHITHSSAPPVPPCPFRIRSGVRHGIPPPRRGPGPHRRALLHHHGASAAASPLPLSVCQAAARRAWMRHSACTALRMTRDWGGFCFFHADGHARRVLDSGVSVPEIQPPEARQHCLRHRAEAAATYPAAAVATWRRDWRSAGRAGGVVAVPRGVAPAGAGGAAGGAAWLTQMKRAAAAALWRAPGASRRSTPLPGYSL